MLTQKKDLRGGVSVWSASAHAKTRNRRTLTREKCDVIVVGAGVSGALIALNLARSGIDVVVVDRRKPITGSTMASTAMIQFEIDQPLTKLSEAIGSSKAERVYRRSFASVGALKTLIDEHKISAAWRWRDALYLTGPELGRGAMAAETHARTRIGLPSEFMTRPQLRAAYGIDRTAAIVSKGSAELDPVQLTAGCLRAAQRLGCRVYSCQEITSVECEAKGVGISTRNGGEITAKKIVFATGYETVAGLPSSSFEITSSWAIATKPIAPADFWPTRCLIWEAADPYLYVRSTRDNRVIVGGEDSGLKDPVRRNAAISAKSQKLLAALSDLLPGRSFEIDYAWAGAFAVSPTGLPIIGPVEGLPNSIAILGCGGNGITFSTIGAEVALAWAKGKQDPDLDLFSL
jgi:glycine/D-amino acid oxidase-like deaminating enzyme